MGWHTTHGAWVAGACAVAPGWLGATLPGQRPWTANISWWTFGVIVLFLVGLVVAGVLAALWFRRMARMDQESGGRETFTFADLRRLRDEKLLSSTEYEMLREGLRRREAAKAQEDKERPNGRLR